MHQGDEKQNEPRMDSNRLFSFGALLTAGAIDE